MLTGDALSASRHGFARRGHRAEVFASQHHVYYALMQMRTTVTLEDDVAAVLSRLEKEGLSPKEVINRAVREFVARQARKPRTAVYRTPTVDLGRCLIGSLDDVSEAIALGEGDNAR
jgi:hypothetical protein